MKSPVRVEIPHKRAAVRAVKPGDEKQKIQGRKQKHHREQK